MSLLAGVAVSLLYVIVVATPRLAMAQLIGWKRQGIGSAVFACYLVALSLLVMPVRLDRSSRFGQVVLIGTYVVLAVGFVLEVGTLIRRCLGTRCGSTRSATIEILPHDLKKRAVLETLIAAMCFVCGVMLWYAV